MKIKFFFVAVLIVVSFYTLFSLVQSEDSRTKMTDASQQSVPSLLLNENNNAENNSSENIIDPTVVVSNLDSSQKYIVYRDAAYILEPSYTIQSSNGTLHNINVFASILGGNVSNYNGTFYSLNLPNYPNILMKINTNEFYIFGDKYTIDSNFVLSGENVYVNLESLSKEIYIDFKLDENQNMIVDFVEKEPFLKDSYVTVLVFHETRVGVNNSISISPENLKMQLNTLKNNDFSFITDSDLLGYIHNWKDIPNNSVIIHFDDGYETFYQNAYPILKELNVPSSMYLLGLTVKEHTGDTETFETPHLSWEQIVEMHNEGLVSFQSHSYNLHTKGVIFQQFNENYEEYVARIENDFNYSKQLIEQRLGVPVISLAYPIGSYDDFIDSLAAKYYPLTMTMDHGVEKGNFDPYKIKRIYGNGNDTATSLIKRLNYD